MLLQKAAQTTAGIRASGRKAASSSSKNRYFSRLEGGLPVTNDAINSITAKSQEDYYNKVSLVKKDGQVPMKDRLSFKDC
jgi:hypothetical protein